MSRIVRDWKPEKVEDALVAPHRYLWDGTIGPNGVRIEGDIAMAKSWQEAKACFAYDEGDVVYLDMGGKAIKAKIWLRIYSHRDAYGFRSECYKVQRETANGLWSKVWEYAYPGFIQRGYQRAGLAPDLDAHENAA